MRVVVTRPEPDASRLAARLSAAGHHPVLAPLLRIEPLATPAWPDRKLAAIVATSRHAVAALPPPPGLADRPFLVVGAETARSAAAQGWTNVSIGNGSAADLVGLIRGTLTPQDGTIVYARGIDVTLDLAAELAPAGFVVQEFVLYRSAAVPSMPASLRAALMAKPGQALGITLLSTRTARCYTRLCSVEDVEQAASRARYYCLSASIATALNDLAPEALFVAERPDLEHILACINRDAAQFDVERSPR